MLSKKKKNPFEFSEEKFFEIYMSLSKFGLVHQSQAI